MTLPNGTRIEDTIAGGSQYRQSALLALAEARMPVPNLPGHAWRQVTQVRDFLDDAGERVRTAANVAFSGRLEMADVAPFLREARVSEETIGRLEAAKAHFALACEGNRWATDTKRHGVAIRVPTETGLSFTLPPECAADQSRIEAAFARMGQGYDRAASFAEPRAVTLRRTEERAQAAADFEPQCVTFESERGPRVQVHIQGTGLRGLDLAKPETMAVLAALTDGDALASVHVYVEQGDDWTYAASAAPIRLPDFDVSVSQEQAVATLAYRTPDTIVRCFDQDTADDVVNMSRAKVAEFVDRMWLIPRTRGFIQEGALAVRLQDIPEVRAAVATGLDAALSPKRERDGAGAAKAAAFAALDGADTGGSTVRRGANDI